MADCKCDAGNVHRKAQVNVKAPRVRSASKHPGTEVRGKKTHRQTGRAVRQARQQANMKRT